VNKLQLESTGFTETDLAKYPFLKQTGEHLKKLELTLEAIVSPENARILDRAEQRVTNSISHFSIGEKSRDNIEIPSFPVAVVLAIATENSFIKKRYALAEAKQASSNLNDESTQKILNIAQDFDWKIKLTPKANDCPPLEFTINFTDYLRNAAHLHDKKWKLTNSILSNGNVYLNKKDVVRLLEEEIRKRIEKRLEAKLPKYPSELATIADRIKKLAIEKIGEMENEELPKMVVKNAFPPCITALIDGASSTHHLSHVERFALVSFLVNIGMSSDAVTELFKTFSDYNERLTRYQVEHIAGERGSGTRYTPPQCSILQTHGVCKNKDDLCRHIFHPLAYYKRKTKAQPKSG
jgi:DNA primase large subunit